MLQEFSILSSTNQRSKMEKDKSSVFLRTADITVFFYQLLFLSFFVKTVLVINAVNRKYIY
jgi:hypothetical protein